MRWIVFALIFVLLQWYAFQAFKSLSKQSWVLWLYWLSGLLVVGNMIYQFNTGQDSRSLTPMRSYAIGFMMTLIVFYLVCTVFMFGEDLVRLLYGTVRKHFGAGNTSFLPSRRKFVGQLALGLAAIPLSSMLYGMYRGKYNYKVLKYRLYYPDLPEAFEGYRLTQISDIHAGSFDNPEKIRHAVDLINEQEADLLLFTGDLVNNLASEMDPWMETFGRLKAKDGVYSILGNHDYGDYVPWNSPEEKEKNLERLKAIHKELGFDLLLNENRSLERSGQKIAVLGVENWGVGGFKKAGDLQKAKKGVDKEAFKILLSHDPSHWEEQVVPDDYPFQLTLSGHTHGMQFGIEIPGWVKWSPVQWRYKQWAGLYEKERQRINVNRGFGYLAFPGRIGIWPEITVIELHKGPFQQESLS